MENKMEYIVHKKIVDSIRKDNDVLHKERNYYKSKYNKLKSQTRDKDLRMLI